MTYFVANYFLVRHRPNFVVEDHRPLLGCHRYLFETFLLLRLLEHLNPPPRIHCSQPRGYEFWSQFFLEMHLLVIEQYLL